MISVSFVVDWVANAHGRLSPSFQVQVQEVVKMPCLQKLERDIFFVDSPGQITFVHSPIWYPLQVRMTRKTASQTEIKIQPNRLSLTITDPVWEKASKFSNYLWEHSYYFVFGLEERKGRYFYFMYLEGLPVFCINLFEDALIYVAKNPSNQVIS